MTIMIEMNSHHCDNLCTIKQHQSFDYDEMQAFGPGGDKVYTNSKRLNTILEWRIQRREQSDGSEDANSQAMPTTAEQLHLSAEVCPILMSSPVVDSQSTINSPRAYETHLGCKPWAKYFMEANWNYAHLTLRAYEIMSRVNLNSG